MDDLFTAYIIGGDFREWLDTPDMPYLKYSGLSVEQVLILAKISLASGFQIVVMNGGEGGGQAQTGQKL